MMYVCCSSANAISDVGVQALAQALVGDYPVGMEECQPLTERPRRRIPILKTLDLGQVRLTWDIYVVFSFKGCLGILTHENPVLGVGQHAFMWRQ